MVKTTGNRAEVWAGLAHKTSGGLTKADLMLNAKGKIVSRKVSAKARSSSHLGGAHRQKATVKRLETMAAGGPPTGRLHHLMPGGQHHYKMALIGNGLPHEGREVLSRANKHFIDCLTQLLERIKHEGKMPTRYHAHVTHLKHPRSTLAEKRQTLQGEGFFDFIKDVAKKVVGGVKKAVGFVGDNVVPVVEKAIPIVKTGVKVAKTFMG